MAGSSPVPTNDTGRAQIPSPGLLLAALSPRSWSCGCPYARSIPVPANHNSKIAERGVGYRSGNQSASSRLALSAESEACTRFSRLDSDRSPRIVPGAALRPSVAPTSARTTSIT
jgi:hypothetical protein